jgi:hypothetical protein
MDLPILAWREAAGKENMIILPEEARQARIALAVAAMATLEKKIENLIVVGERKWELVATGTENEVVLPVADPWSTLLSAAERLQAPFMICHNHPCEPPDHDSPQFAEASLADCSTFLNLNYCASLRGVDYAGAIVTSKWGTRFYGLEECFQRIAEGGWWGHAIDPDAERLARSEIHSQKKREKEKDVRSRSLRYLSGWLARR